MKCLEIDAMKIDDVVRELPNYREFIDSGDYAEMAYSGFTENLKTLLEKLDAGEVRVYPENNMQVTVEFQPIRSPYFRVGNSGKGEMNLWHIAAKKDRKFRGTTYKDFEKTILNENLRGTISIGFYDGSDSMYEDGDIPDVILKYFYVTDKTPLETDVTVLKCDNWRHAIAEFFQYFVEFDYALSTKQKTETNTRILTPALPIKRTIQKSLPSQ